MKHSFWGRRKVALVTNAMRFGGVETFILQLARYLSDHGVFVEIVTTTEPGEGIEQVSDAGLLTRHIGGYVSGRRLQLFTHSWRVGQWLKAQKYDAILLNHALYAQASLARLPDEVFVAPILHNDAETVYKVALANRFAWNVLVGVSPRLCQNTQLRIGNRPVEYIPHGVDLPSAGRLKPNRDHDDQFHVVYVGRLEHRQKGILLIPEILRKCLENGLRVTLTVAGTGPDRENLEHDVHSAGVAEHVKFVGLLSRQDVYTLFSSAHIMLMPSFFEGLGISLLEAQACGCVPVASRIEQVTDVAVVDGCTGRLVNIGDVQGFVDAIVELACAPTLWHQMSQAAQHHISSHFSISTMGSAYLRLIERGLQKGYPLPRSRSLQAPIDLGLANWKR